MNRHLENRSAEISLVEDVTLSTEKNPVTSRSCSNSLKVGIG